MKTTTKLEAVNSLLATIGEAPVNALGEEQVFEVSLAESALDEVAREVQTEGWAFNTEYDYVFSLNDISRVPCPDNILHADLDPADFTDIQPVRRGSYFYDRANQTFTFSAALTARRVVLALDFEYMPESMKRYVTIRAARLFQQRVVGSTVLYQFTERDEYLAKRQMLADENKVEDRNLRNNPTIAAILRRR